MTPEEKEKLEEIKRLTNSRMNAMRGIEKMRKESKKKFKEAVRKINERKEI